MTDTFGDFMISEAVKKDNEMTRLREAQIVRPGAKLFVESFGITRQGVIARQVDSDHVEFTLEGYPGALYTASVKDIRLSVNQIHVQQTGF